MDKFEEGRSRRCQVIDRKRKGYRQTKGLANVHIVSYFASTDVFMSIHKPIITLTLLPFHEITNRFHAKYLPISSKCWLRRTDGWTDQHVQSNMPSLLQKGDITTTTDACQLAATTIN